MEDLGKPRRSLDYLPEAMVEEMLGKHSGVVQQVSSLLQDAVKYRRDVRRHLEDLGLLTNVMNLLSQKTYPTTAGVDGSYGTIRQLALDLVSIAAVAVEGLVPPKETRKLQKPDHIVDIFPVAHHPWTSRLCSSLMFSYELELANRMPHRVVFLDGSLTTPLIQLGQGLSAIDQAVKKTGQSIPTSLSNRLLGRIRTCLEDYQRVLTSPRTDQIFVGVPKYSSRIEVISKLRERGFTFPAFSVLNDRALLTAVLEPGEVILPLEISPTEEEKKRWHLSGVEAHPDLEGIAKDVKESVGNLYVMYFRPSAAHPVLRLEVSPSVARNRHRLSILLEALLDQTRIPGIMEPYPLYVADLFVKHAYGALVELREASLSDVDRVVGGEFSHAYLSLHSYRTEGGYE